MRCLKTIQGNEGNRSSGLPFLIEARICQYVDDEVKMRLEKLVPPLPSSLVGICPYFSPLRHTRRESSGIHLCFTEPSPQEPAEKSEPF